MDPDRAYERAERNKALAHPTRLRILAEPGGGKDEVAARG